MKFKNSLLEYKILLTNKFIKLHFTDHEQIICIIGKKVNIIRKDNNLVEC